MKRLAVTLFFVAIFSATAFGQSPTLTITCETAGLPCDLFYGSTKVKPVRLRPGTNTPITINDSDFFIQQQYIDFLKRFPEPSCPPNQCGLDFYVPILNGCGANIDCLRYTRGALSANFFRSPEFNNKGRYVADLYNVALGQRPKTVAELGDATKVERPHYSEFFADLSSISTPNDDPTLTNQLKDQLATNFLTRTDVINTLGGYTPSWTRSQLVTRLEQIAGLTLTNRDSLINSSMTHPQILRAVAENSQVMDKFYIQDFVTMEYLGYLRRDPENCHQSSDPANCGVIFHYKRFNDLLPQIGSDLTQNFLVRGFIESPEYVGRF
jgi:hypothetical protein